MLSYVAWWERIVDGNDIEELRAVVTRDDETDNDMRNLSPLRVPLTEDERQQFLEEFWAHWPTRGECDAVRTSPHASRVPCQQPHHPPARPRYRVQSLTERLLHPRVVGARREPDRRLRLLRGRRPGRIRGPRV